MNQRPAGVAAMARALIQFLWTTPDAPTGKVAIVGVVIADGIGFQVHVDSGGRELTIMPGDLAGELHQAIFDVLKDAARIEASENILIELAPQQEEGSFKLSVAGGAEGDPRWSGLRNLVLLHRAIQERKSATIH